MVKEPASRKCARCGAGLKSKTLRVIVYSTVYGEVAGVGFLCGEC